MGTFRCRLWLEAPGESQYLVAMSTTVEQLAKQAMNLPGELRARLADLLVESLDADALTKIDQLWLSEAKRRRDEVRSGKDRKSTRLNSSHSQISYAVFCLKKKK